MLINGMPVERVKDFKYLGVIFDERLEWHNHTNSIFSEDQQKNVLFEKT